MRVGCCGATRVERMPFLRALGAKGRRKLRGVVSGPGYQSIIASRLRDAVHVLDRFHIVQWMNEALNELRRRLFSGAPRDELGRALKVKKWLLLLSARENLEPRHRRMLDALVEQNQPLYEAYLLKEQLRSILKYPWRHVSVMRGRLPDWIEAVSDSGLKELGKVARLPRCRVLQTQDLPALLTAGQPVGEDRAVIVEPIWNCERSRFSH